MEAAWVRSGPGGVSGMQRSLAAVDSALAVRALLTSWSPPGRSARHFVWRGQGQAGRLHRSAAARLQLPGGAARAAVWPLHRRDATE